MIYFDNSATTFPKPDVVLENTFEFIKQNTANPGRSAHKLSVEASKQIFECRLEIAKLFNIQEPNQIAFTKNCSEALNIGLLSCIQEGDHVITSIFEHNSIIRCLEHLKLTKNIDVSYIEPDENFVIADKQVARYIKQNTKLIVLNHADNLLGTFNDIGSIGSLAKQKNIIFLVDTAQSAGKIDIDVQKMNIDILCASGHKSLYGFSGTGFIYAGENINLKPMIFGGTGSFSDEMSQPEIMPDMLETGTLNTVGIKSLLEGIKWLKNIGIQRIFEKENLLTHYMIEKLKNIEKVIVYTPKNEKLAGIVSFNIKGLDSSYVAGVLDLKYDIATRSGLHCNPLGHKYLGTLTSGFIRISLSYFNDIQDIEDLIFAVKQIVKEEILS